MFLTVKFETIIKSPNKQIIRNTRLQYEQGIKGYLIDVGSVLTHQFEELGCLVPFSTIFQLYRGSQFYRWSTRRKTRYAASHSQSLSHVSMNILEYLS
jgi:hypothetical protein